MQWNEKCVSCEWLLGTGLLRRNFSWNVGHRNAKKARSFNANTFVQYDLYKNVHRDCMNSYTNIKVTNCYKQHVSSNKVILYEFAQCDSYRTSVGRKRIIQKRTRRLYEFIYNSFKGKIITTCNEKAYFNLCDMCLECSVRRYLWGG